MSLFDDIIVSRRDFLKTTGIVGAGITLLSYSPLGLLAEEPKAPDGKAIPGFPDDRIFVFVELAGGNDGLNTVIPLASDAYYKKRPNLGIAKGEILKLSDDFGLNPGMKAFQRLYGDGKLCVINGVGYPNPDRSHFRSMDIWQTASDSDKYESTGWLGRYIASCAANKPMTVCAVNIGDHAPLAFFGSQGYGVSFQRPEGLRWKAGEEGNSETAYRRLNKTAGIKHDTSSTLGFLRQNTADAVQSSDMVLKAANNARKKPQYPQGRLSQTLSQVADLILGGLPTRVYYVSHGGFDTHANQKNQHQNLLQQFTDAVEAFQKDLSVNGHSKRTLIACFSEFGRRVEENASGGTDHGTAGPMFLIGDAIKGGFSGRYPDLEALDRQGDFAFTTDFRSVYSGILKLWLKSDPGKILGKNFEALNFLS